MGLFEISLIGVGLAMDAASVAMTNGMVYKKLSPHSTGFRNPVHGRQVRTPPCKPCFITITMCMSRRSFVAEVTICWVFMPMLFVNFDHAGPFDDKRNAGTSFQNAVFACAEGAGGGMGGVVPDGEIPVAVIQHGAVVAGEDHQGVFFQTGLLQSLCNAAHTVIQFHGHVTAHAVPALAHKAFFRAARHVDVMRGEHQEKRFLGFGALLNVFNGLIRNDIGVFLILPQGAFAALHESDASDSVDNGLVVSVAPHEFELVLIVLAIGKPGEVVPVGYFNGVVRVQVADIAVFQNHTGNAVARSGEDKALVKSDFVRAGGDMFVPVNFLPLFPQALRRSR